MKRLMLVWVMALCMIVSIFSCAEGENQSDSGIPTSENVESQRCFVRPSSREGVDGFIAVIGNIRVDGLLSGADFNSESCYNVTPERVAAETDIRIYQFSRTAASFALVDGEVYEICRWFGGWGFFDAYPWDYDGDGQTDLLITSSWGSGLHRAELSVFNRATKEITVLYDTTEDGLCYRGIYDLCFNDTVITDPYEGNGIIAVGIDYVQLVVTENDDYPYHFEKCGSYGAIQLEMDKPVFRSMSHITGKWQLYTRTDCTETINVLAEGPDHCSVLYEFRNNGTYHYQCEAWFGRERSDDRTGTYVVCGNWLVLDDAETIWISTSVVGLTLHYSRFETLIDTLIPAT